LKGVARKYAEIMRAKHIDPAAIIKMANSLSFQGAYATFQREVSSVGFTSQFAAALPPPGTCMVGVKSQYSSLGPSASGRGEDAGPQLMLTGPNGSRTLDPTSNGSYQLSMDDTSSLPAGTYFVSSNGGADVGPFTASLQVGTNLMWTNKDDIRFIDRSQPLTITWSGGPPTGYVLFGGSGSSKDKVAVAFTCVEDVRNQTLTVPDYVLSAIPHTTNGTLFLTPHPMQNLFSATGIDVGFFADLSVDSKTLGVQ